MIEILELFCGRGGWSKGFAELGCNCTGVDNRRLSYPFRFIKADIFDWMPDKKYDVVIASPPCSQFCLPMRNCQGTGDERQGLDLVWRTYEIINQIKPVYYIIENVKQLSEFLPGHVDTVRYGRQGNRKSAYLWGNFPKIGMLQQEIHFKIDWNNTYKPKRAEIPIALSRAVAASVVSSLKQAIA